MKKTGQKVLGVIAPILVFLVLFGFWQIMCVKNNVPQWLLPAPIDIIKCMFNNFAEFWPHILITFETILVGFIIAVPFGILALFLCFRVCPFRCFGILLLCLRVAPCPICPRDIAAAAFQTLYRAILHIIPVRSGNAADLLVDGKSYIVRRHAAEL